MTLKTKLQSLPLYLQILFGMIGGILIGIAGLSLNGEKFILDWIRPWGQLFIRLLQLIAIPLVFTSLIKGVTGLGDISKFSRMGGRTILLYMLTTIFAVIIGVGMGWIVQPGKLVNSSQITEMQESYNAVVEEKKLEAEMTQEQGPLNFLNDIVPNNIIRATSDNSKMLQVIFFAIFLGLLLFPLRRKRLKQ
ncbi:MAG: dicarboxylate/amino acid:cation symporter [Tannerellaceae bacterium]|nr:dicarboxylate/amino acid:cation symporter [Tannerellaceae bacterium]